MRSFNLWSNGVKWQLTNLEGKMLRSQHPPIYGNVRVCLSSRAFWATYAKAHANSTLVAHVPDSAPRPRGLHVTHMSRNAVVAAIDKQCNSYIDDLCNERIRLFIRRVRFDLGEDERIPVVDDGFGQSGYYASPRVLDRDKMHAKEVGERTSLRQWEQLLEPYGDDVWCTPFAQEEARDLEGWGQPIDQILGKTMNALQICVVGCYLNQETVGEWSIRFDHGC